MVKIYTQQPSTSDSEYKFFSTKFSVTIGGTKYRPSICYEIPVSIKPTIEQLASEGRATLYKTRVRFVSGAVLG